MHRHAHVGPYGRLCSAVGCTVHALCAVQRFVQRFVQFTVRRFVRFVRFRFPRFARLWWFVRLTLHTVRGRFRFKAFLKAEGQLLDEYAIGRIDFHFIAYHWAALGELWPMDTRQDVGGCWWGAHWLQMQGRTYENWTYGCPMEHFFVSFLFI